MARRPGPRFHTFFFFLYARRQRPSYAVGRHETLPVAPPLRFRTVSKSRGLIFVEPNQYRFEHFQKYVTRDVLRFRMIFHYKTWVRVSRPFANPSSACPRQRLWLHGDIVTGKRVTSAIFFFRLQRVLTHQSTLSGIVVRNVDQRHKHSFKNAHV